MTPSKNVDRTNPLHKNVINKCTTHEFFKRETVQVHINRYPKGYLIGLNITSKSNL